MWITKVQPIAVHEKRIPPGERKASDRNSSPRTSILQATIDLYREIGHSKTTVGDIACRCTMSPANVYRFFRSKQAIEEAVVAELFEAEFQELANVERGCGTPLSRLEAILRTLSQLQERRLASDGRLNELVAAATNANWPVVLGHVARIVGLMAPIISAGQARGEIRDGRAAALASCLLAAMNTHVMARELRGESLRPSFDEMADFCVKALCRPPSRQSEQSSRRSVDQR